jgi:hypothetical protein
MVGVERIILHWTSNQFSTDSKFGLKGLKFMWYVCWCGSQGIPRSGDKAQGWELPPLDVRVFLWWQLQFHCKLLPLVRPSFLYLVRRFFFIINQVPWKYILNCLIIHPLLILMNVRNVHMQMRTKPCSCQRMGRFDVVVNPWSNYCPLLFQLPHNETFCAV